MTAPIIGDPSRRQFLTVLAAIGLLTACGSNSTGSTGVDTSAGDFPLTVRHAFGSTVIPAAPQRVVTVGYSEQDPVLALGIAPVGIREWFGKQPFATWEWARDELGDARPEVLGLGDGLEFEKITALRPDLILAPLGGILEAEYPILARIAPTIAHSTDVPEYGTPWPELTRSVGRMLGRTDRAEEAVAAILNQFAEVVAAHPEFAGKSAVAAYDFGTAFGVYGPTQDPRGRFLVDLGFAFPPALASLFEAEEFYGEISREQLGLLEADVVVWVVYRDSGQEGVAGIEVDPVYRSLRVSREGRHVFLSEATDPVNAAFSFSSVLSLPLVLERLVPKIATALDGDPTTV
ncbi:MAG: iron-siderophore ABC transporter substrate-binding protein [Pseudonocardia sp.]